MEQLSLSEFDRLPLHKLVYKKLRESILNGNIPPGTKLIENDISRQLQISKTPIREAIRELSQEGLIVHTTRKGIHVIEFDKNDVAEIIFLRSELEGLGFSLAKNNLNTEDLSYLENLLKQLGEHEKSKLYRDMARIDMEFHKVVMKKCNNSRLFKAWKNIASQMQALLNSIDYYSLSPDYAQKNHTEILEYLKDPSKGDVSLCIREHILLSGDLIYERINKVKKVVESPEGLVIL